MAAVLATLNEWAGKHPDKLLYSFLDVNGNAVATHSYETFLNRVGVIAAHLGARPELRAGDRVLLVYPPGLETICGLFACAQAGLIPVPTAPPAAHGSAGTLYRLGHIASDCQASAVLSDRASLQQIRHAASAHEAIGAHEHLKRLPWIVTEELHEAGRRWSASHGSDIFFLQYTSGSTSRPRGVVVTNQNVLHNCRLVVDHADPVAVSWLPQHHDMGLLGYYVYVALSGGTTYGFSPASFVQRPSLWLQTITKHRATGTSAPNFAFDYCLRPGRVPAASLERIDLRSLRFLMAAAEPINPDTYRRFLQKFEPHGLRRESFVVAYGLAENTLAVTNYGRRAIPVTPRRRSRMNAHAPAEGSAPQVMSCGQPLRGNTVRVVDPKHRRIVADGAIGEVWVTGASKCQGYWNKAALTRRQFRARISGDDERAEYLRTGDMGFLHEGELFVCGRRKDLIIVRGQNYYPHDVEVIAAEAAPFIRRGSVAAFALDGAGETVLGVVAEVTGARAIPDGRAVAARIKTVLGLDAAVVAFVPAKSLPKTSSGKIMRYLVKRMWTKGQFTILSKFEPEVRSTPVPMRPISAASPLEFLKQRYQLTGRECGTLADAGVDSLDLVSFVQQLKELLASCGGGGVADQIDPRLAQQIPIAVLFELIDRLERAPAAAVDELLPLLSGASTIYAAEDRAGMARDRTLAFVPPSRDRAGRGQRGAVLLTGGTGFLGPFLLHSLLEQTHADVHVLVRASSAAAGLERVRRGLIAATGATPALLDAFDRRVNAVCGDLAKTDLGLSPARWQQLAEAVDVVYHNGAAVNYLSTYAAMRAANVAGTNHVLKLAFAGGVEQFNYISTTFIFGWARKSVLYETDRNDSMERLDFGYSQSKWTAEQVVGDAARHGLRTRTFRPALITPSVCGGGSSSFDIVIRLLAFMIKHGIAVDALNQVSFVPADVTANNIVAIANLPDTLDRTFHVTRDEYANMVDVIDIIRARTGRAFQQFALRDFVPELIRRCTSSDLLYPLLDFLTGSVDNISAMEFKRYDNSSYRRARAASSWGRPDPSLEDTVGGILSFMQRTAIL